MEEWSWFCRLLIVVWNFMNIRSDSDMSCEQFYGMEICQQPVILWHRESWKFCGDYFCKSAKIWNCVCSVAKSVAVTHKTVHVSIQYTVLPSFCQPYLYVQHVKPPVLDPKLDRYPKLIVNQTSLLIDNWYLMSSFNKQHRGSKEWENKKDIVESASIMGSSKSNHS